MNPAAARRLTDALLAAGDDLLSFPGRGRPVRDNLRELVVVYPYVIRYEIIGNQVTILGVRHGKRRPD
ncbi:MAG: type II toxin-antitoxin system RelE/ParE family toxin [Alphaproteobacteria bacterium]